MRTLALRLINALARRLLQPLADRAGMPALFVVEVAPRRPAPTPLVERLHGETEAIRYRTRLMKLNDVLERALGERCRCAGCLGPQ